VVDGLAEPLVPEALEAIVARISKPPNPLAAGAVVRTAVIDPPAPIPAEPVVPKAYCPPALEAPPIPAEPVVPKANCPAPPKAPDPPMLPPPNPLADCPSIPGKSIRYGWTDFIVASTPAMLVGDTLELALEDVEPVDDVALAWIADATAAWSDWICVIWLWVKPMLDHTAAVSVWTVVTACDPVSVPFMMASKSSSTWPIEAFVA
jgi:hypothetical protein